MRVIKTHIYEFHELSDKAKEKAREWYRRSLQADSDSLESVYNDAAHAAQLFGFDIRTRRVNLGGGSFYYAPNIYFSGFSSQGSGACCEGTWRASDVQIGVMRTEYPKDVELQRIAAFFEFLAPRYPRARFSVTHRGHYYHSGCTEFDFQLCPDDPYQEMAEGITQGRIQDETRAFMDWIYRALEREWDHQNSDEVVDEGIAANGYEFTADGEGA